MYQILSLEVEVKVGFFAESDKEIEETLYDFLKNRLKEGMYSGDCDVEFVLVE